MPKTEDAQHRKGSERSKAHGRREAEPSELRRFEPVSDAQVLAAVERAIEPYQDAFENGDLDPARFKERLSALDTRLDTLHE